MNKNYKVKIQVIYPIKSISEHNEMDIYLYFSNEKIIWIEYDFKQIKILKPETRESEKVKRLKKSKNLINNVNFESTQNINVDYVIKNWKKFYSEISKTEVTIDNIKNIWNKWDDLKKDIIYNSLLKKNKIFKMDNYSSISIENFLEILENSTEESIDSYNKGYGQYRTKLENNFDNSEENLEKYSDLITKNFNKNKFWIRKIDNFLTGSKPTGANTNINSTKLECCYKIDNQEINLYFEPVLKKIYFNSENIISEHDFNKIVKKENFQEINFEDFVEKNKIIKLALLLLNYDKSENISKKFNKIQSKEEKKMVKVLHSNFLDLKEEKKIKINDIWIILSLFNDKIIEKLILSLRSEYSIACKNLYKNNNNCNYFYKEIKLNDFELLENAHIYSVKNIKSELKNLIEKIQKNKNKIPTKDQIMKFFKIINYVKDPNNCLRLPAHIHKLLDKDNPIIKLVQLKNQIFKFKICNEKYSYLNNIYNLNSEFILNLEQIKYYKKQNNV